MNSWREIVEAEDTKVATLERLYLQNRTTPGFLASVASSVPLLDEDAAWRAVWILRRAARDGLLGSGEVQVLAQSVESSRHWASRLLFCQFFAQVECPESEREQVVGYLLDCFQDRRVIVRAWALSAMWRFGRDPRFRPDILRCMRIARKDSGKAMQARLRRLIPRG